MNAFDIESSSGTMTFHEAFEQVLPEMKALPDRAIVSVNLSIPGAVAKVLGLERVLCDLRDRSADPLPGTERDFPGRSS